MKEAVRNQVIKQLQAHSILLIRRAALIATKNSLASTEIELDASVQKLKQLVESDPYLKKRIPDVLANAVIRYGVRLLNLKHFSHVFLPLNGLEYTALFYEVYGSDVLKYLDSVGRPVVMYKGYPFDKIEVGNRLEIPWSLIDSVEDHTTKQSLLDLYLVGVVGNKALSEELGSGISVECKPNKKQIEIFETYLKRVTKPKVKSKVDEDIEKSTVKKTKSFSAAQARGTYSWADKAKSQRGNYDN